MTPLDGKVELLAIVRALNNAHRLLSSWDWDALAELMDDMPVEMFQHEEMCRIARATAAARDFMAQLEEL